MAAEHKASRILVVDDEEDVLNLLRDVLAFEKYDVVTAHDGKEALTHFRNHNGFDLVITDLMMPGISGLEVLEQVKDHDPITEVVLLTGHGSHDTAIKAMRNGAYDYLQKPMDMMELLLIVQKALERRKLSLENRNYQQNLERIVRERTAELTDTKNFLQRVLESSLDYSIIATNCDGIITLFNRGSEFLLGYRASEVVGKETVLLFTPDDQKGTGTYNQAGDDDGVDVHHEREKVVRRKDGTLITINLSVSTLVGSDGEVDGYLGIAQDITEEKKLQEEVRRHTEHLEDLVRERTGELAERNRELEETIERLNQTQAQLIQSEKMASLGQLSAGVAHEINNPMGFITSNLGALKKYTSRLTEALEACRKRAEEQQVCDLEEINQIWKEKRIAKIIADLDDLFQESLDGAHRVKSIVQDLKSFSHEGRARMMHANLIEGIESTLNIVRNEIKYKAEVEKEFQPIPEVFCNPQQINQVLLNLIVNAAQAIKETPGKINIRTGTVDNDQIWIEVSDNGTGIEQEKLDRIFDPFFTTKDVGEGSGLGLSISYRIIQDHNGSIDVESTPGEGTTFRIKLPVQGPGAETESEE